MTALFKKLNFKYHPAILVIGHPESFQRELAGMEAETPIVTDAGELERISFVLAFVTAQSQIDRIANQIAPKLDTDAVCWFCYPKASSKRYTCDFNRDTGWAIMGQHDLEPVRQVAIDEDWSALRFRNVDRIKKITRRGSMALTEKARQRTSAKPPQGNNT